MCAIIAKKKRPTSIPQVRPTLFLKVNYSGDDITRQCVLSSEKECQPNLPPAMLETTPHVRSIDAGQFFGGRSYTHEAERSQAVVIRSMLLLRQSFIYIIACLFIFGQIRVILRFMNTRRPSWTALCPWQAVSAYHGAPT